MACKEMVNNLTLCELYHKMVNCNKNLIYYESCRHIRINRCLHASLGIDCDGAEVSSRAGTITLFSSLIISIPGLLIIGFYGSFADKYGFKKTLSAPGTFQNHL